MEINQMNHDEIVARKAEIKELLNDENCDVDALTQEIDALEARDNEIKKNAEERTALLNKVAEEGTVIEKVESEERKQMTDLETRANQFVETGKMETRAILATGKIAKPTEVGGIENVGSLVSSIVDDVTAVEVAGNGSYVVAYEKTHAEGKDVADGAALTGTSPAYDYVEINPTKWGVITEISNLVKNTSPLNYQNAVERSSLNGLRKVAANKIIAALTASTLAEAKTVALDADYLKNLALALEARPELGEMKLYLSRAALVTLGAVRGTDKKAVFEISMKDSMNGSIKEGGLAVPYSIIEGNAQFFGQPKAIHLAMWGDYEIATDEGGKYFEKDLIGVRGKAVAGADLCAPVFFKVTQA